jgi:hypothetical protein
MGRAWASLLLLSLCTYARAQQACPWLTQGTAGALLGEEVRVTVHGSADEGDCEFVPSADGDHSDTALNNGKLMKIVVGHQLPKECAAGERLTGIGQDSTLCLSDAGGVHREIIRGRVRNRYFLITVSARKASASDEASSRHALEQLAEEVAGNLF